MNKYNFEGINFPLKDDDWIEIEKNALTIALNILYAKKENIYPSGVSLKLWKQVILFMIPNGIGQHYLAAKELSTLLRRKSNSDFYCLNCVYSFATENKLESHKKVCENKDFCNIVMYSEDAKFFLSFSKNLIQNEALSQDMKIYKLRQHNIYRLKFKQNSLYSNF